MPGWDLFAGSYPLSSIKKICICKLLHCPTGNFASGNRELSRCWIFWSSKTIPAMIQPGHILVLRWGRHTLRIFLCYFAAEKLDSAETRPKRNCFRLRTPINLISLSRHCSPCILSPNTLSPNTGEQIFRWWIFRNVGRPAADSDLRRIHFPGTIRKGTRIENMLLAHS